MNLEEKAGKILELVGGKENVSHVTFCMTRLRITPKDRGLVQDEAVKNIEDIVGTKTVGSQYQVIIGPQVEQVYKAFCKLAGIAENPGIDAGVSQVTAEEKKKFTFKGALNGVMDAISGCVTPMIPIITAAGLVKLIVAILGPSMLNIMPATSDLMRILTIVGDAGFYFFPMFVAYGAAKRFKCSIPMALFIAGILLHPGLIEIANAGKPFSIYGIPMVAVTYSSNFISMLLITWVMSYVENGLNKIIPTTLRSLLFPLLLTLIMLPLSLCALGPIGHWLGQGIAAAIQLLHTYLGPVAIAIVAALWPLLVVTGMHQALIAIAMSNIATLGFDQSITVGGFLSTYSVIAVVLAYILKTKNKKEKVAASTSFITLTLGGISEPALFGVILRHKKAMLYMIAGGFAGGFYAGLMGVKTYFFGSGSILAALSFAGPDTSSLTNGVIGGIICFAVAFIPAIIFGFGKEGKAVEE